MTEWRQVVGYEGLYMVSDDGQVFAESKSVRVGRNGGVDTREGRILKQGTIPQGHMRVWLAKNGKKRGRSVHRLVADAFIPNPENLPVVNHIDSDPTNNSIENLEWTTLRGNAKHAFDAGRVVMPSQVGAANSAAKFTVEQVRAMRAMYVEIGNASEVARRFGVPKKTAYDICHFRRWKHID